MHAWCFCMISCVNTLRVMLLLQVAGVRTVPVELGAHYLADGWGTRLMTLAEFIDSHILATSTEDTSSPLVGPPDVPPAETTTPAVAGGGGSGSGEGGVDGRKREVLQQDRRQVHNQQANCPVGYLAQHPLFEQIPALRGDIVTPDYCLTGQLRSTNAWFGPAGTVTPLHTDPYHNLLAQVVGCKYVRLYSPHATPQLRPYTEGLTTNSSTIDLDDAQAAAQLEGVPFWETLLRPGQVLYIPPGWWHYVKSLAVSFSVSFWWEQC